MEKPIEKKDPFNLTKRKRLFLAVTPAIFIALVVIFNYFFNFTVEKETFYYSFSTIAQTIIALIAFLGTIVIFRLQTYENRRSELITQLRVYNNNVIRSADQVLERAKKFSSKDGNDNYGFIVSNEEVGVIINEIDVIDSSSDTIKFKMIDFSLLAVLNSVVALIGLFLTPLLSNLTTHIIQNSVDHSLMLGKSYLFFNIVFSCFSLIYALIVILEIFKSITKRWDS